MVSAIDPTKPAAGAASTADVRNNFAAAKSEIEALQTGKQAASARLAALAAILLAADKLLYAIGSDSFATADLTAFARTLLASPNAAAARTVLGAAAPAATLAGYGIADAYTKAQTDAAISAGATSALALFVGSAPAALDTWAELVAAIQADQTGLGALTAAVAGKAAMADVNAAITAAVSAIAFSALTGKPTSLAGYGITDAYTKTEVDTKVAVGAASIGAGDSSLRVTDTGADAGIVVGKIDGVDVMKVGTPASVQPTKNLAGADSTNPNVLTVYAAKGNLRLHAAHGDDNAAAPGQGATALIYGGYASPGSGKAGGSAYLIGGKADGVGTGGNAGVSAGSSSGGSGGTAYLEGGQGAGFGGPALVRGGPGANGGSVSLLGGDPSDGSGGSVTIGTPDSVGTNKQGADLIVSVGHGTGTARHGQLQAIIAGDVVFTVGGTFRLNGSRVATIADIPVGSTVAFANVTGKPTTLVGYGIADTYTAAQVDAKIAAAVASFAAAAGQIVPFAGSTLPPNTLWCDGSYYEPSQYPLLYAAIGFAYGQQGTKFRVPSLGGRFPMGADGTHPRGSVGGSAETQALHLPVGTIVGDWGSGPKGVGVLAAGQTGYLTGLHVYDEGTFTDWALDGPYTTTAPAAGAQASLQVVGADGTPTTGTSGNIPPYQAVNWIIAIGVTAG